MKPAFKKFADVNDNQEAPKSGWKPIVVENVSEIQPKKKYDFKTLKEFVEDQPEEKDPSVKEQKTLTLEEFLSQYRELEEQKQIEETFEVTTSNQDVEQPLITEEVQNLTEPSSIEPPDEKSIIDLASEYITKELKLKEQDSYQQPNSNTVPPNFNEITRKLKFLEDWIAKISLTGPGGGAGDVINLDHPVKLVTSDYTITRRDYYVGVNSISTVTITLPDSIGFPGRKVVIKDESGNCSSNPITVNCNVDNDPGGFILAEDNGGIQMIYREGWRII